MTGDNPKGECGREKVERLESELTALRAERDEAVKAAEATLWLTCQREELQFQVQDLRAKVADCEAEHPLEPAWTALLKAARRAWTHRTRDTFVDLGEALVQFPDSDVPRASKGEK